MADFLQSMSNLQQGRELDPSQDKLYANDPRYMPTLDPMIRGDVTPIPLGDFSDPISQLAFVLVPLAKAFMSRQVTSPPRLQGFLSNQRGSTGGSEGENTLEAFKRMFLSRGGVESGEGTAYTGPAYNKNLLKQDLTLETPKEAIPLPKVTELPTFVQQGLKATRDFYNINKTYLKQALDERKIPYTDKNIDRLFEFLKRNKFVSENPANDVSKLNYGLHSVDEQAINSYLGIE